MKVKVCCISSILEAEMAIEFGADLVGLVRAMPCGPGIISDDEIREIVESVSGRVETVLLTSETSVQGIVDHHEQVNTSCIQIVDRLSDGKHGELKAALPRVKILQVLHVNDESAIEEAVNLGKSVDYILLDSGNPNAEIKTFGGTGKTHNWDISAEIVKRAEVPVFLAGGLRAENVSRAISGVKPQGLDLCSGVRLDGRLNRRKLDSFFKKVRKR